MHQVASVPIILSNDQLFVPVQINNAPAKLLLDTGASISTIATTTASTLSLPHDFDHTAEIQGVGATDNHLYIGAIDSIDIGALHLTNLHLPIADFTQKLDDGTNAAGLLGADILEHYDIDLDIPNRRIIFWQITGCDTIQPNWTSAYTTIPLQRDNARHVTLAAHIDDTQLNLTLDTGAQGLVLTTLAAARAGATPDILAQDPQIDGRGVNDRGFGSHLHIFDRLSFGGATFMNVRAAVVYEAHLYQYDGLLGLDFLTRRHVWLSYATNTLLIQGGADLSPQ